MRQQTVRLDRITRAFRLHYSTVLKWVERGLIHSAEPPRPGRGYATRLTHDQAIEAVALIMLRKAGAPMQQLAPIVRRMRKEGKRGADFLKLGADPRLALLDGLGPGVPLRNPRTGQTQLFADLDLREFAGVVHKFVDDLVAEERELEREEVGANP